MNLEYLIVGIAKENQDDLKEFYNRTYCSAYALALAYTKDRFLAKAVVIEAYRRVMKYAYKFDTDMNAEYWLLDIVKNLSVNALCDGELTKLAGEMHLDNISILIRNAILETDEDRGKIIMLRTVSSLSKSETAALLWYNKASCDGEFGRGIRQLVAMQPEERSKAGVKEQLPLHIKECAPQMLDEILSERETIVAKVSHKNYMIGDDEFALPGESKENRKQRIAVKKAADRKKRIITVCVVAAIVCALIAGGLIWWFIENGDTNLENPEDEYTVIEPQYDSRIALAEKNGVLYYQNLSDQGFLYSMDLNDSSAKPVKLCETAPDELVIEDGYLYYRSGGSVYRRELAAAPGTEGEKLDVNGVSIDIYNEKIYFCSNPAPSVYRVSRMKLDGTDVETVYEATTPIPYVKVAEDGSIYFSLGANNKNGVNFFRLVLHEGDYTEETLQHSGVYDFQLSNSAAYFDVVDAKLDPDAIGTGSIYRVEVVDGIVNTDVMSAVLLSAAFYADGEYIYYYGCKEIDENGEPVEKGIYRISADVAEDGGNVGGEPVLAVSLGESEYDVSDMYVSGGYLYCYSCTGEKEGAFMKLEAYELDGEGLVKSNGSTVIFSVKAG